MTAVDNTGTVLYRYLRTLSVRVSRSTVHRLLDTPVGGSMRGISDALDALHVKNEVYQLPPSPDYFAQLEAPFITMLQADNNPFRVVTKKDDSIVEFENSERLGVDRFLKKWTGTVLFGEVTEETPDDAWCRWKDVGYFLWRRKAVIALILSVVLGISVAWQQNPSHAFTLYLGILAFGIFISTAILYKEQFDDKFLDRFCHIGQAIDCNQVLRSKGASIAGVGLGELSLLYFVIQFLFCILCPTDFYGLSLICGAAAFAFTLYSVFYQVFVIRKGCMLCMLVILTVWAGFVLLCTIGRHTPFSVSLFTCSVLFAVGCICLTAGLSIKALHKDRQAKAMLQHRLTGLLTPDAFRCLLLLEASIERPIEVGKALLNRPGEGDRLMIVTNPNCGNCAKVHRQVEELAEFIPLSLLLLTFPGDRMGEYIAQTVIAAYLTDGWQKAVSLLGEWFRDRRISEADRYPVTPEAEQIWREQQEYCTKQGIDKTPATMTAGHYTPEVYPLDVLRYVLT